MSTTFRDISAALSGRLNTLTGGTPIAWENSEYTPTMGTMFLRETLLPANTVQGSLGTIGKDEHGGIYQVDIFAPKGSGKGRQLPRRIQLQTILNVAQRSRITANQSEYAMFRAQILGMMAAG